MTDQAQQVDLFSEIAAASRRLEEKPPAQRHSATSREAAESIAVVAGTLRHQVLAYIVEAGMSGATDEQIQRGLGMSPNTERPRRIELMKAKLIWDLGNRRVTDSGRLATAWRATPAGVAALEASRRTQ